MKPKNSIHLEGIKNDVQIVIDDVFAVLEKIVSEVENLKAKTSRPDKDEI